MGTYEDKRNLRKEMAARKRAYPADTLQEMSERIMERVEADERFRSAPCVALYHAIAGEVRTDSLLDRWYRRKRLLLPRIEGERLRLLPYEGAGSIRQGAYGIWEPLPGGSETPPEEISLIIVPGIAFDRAGNRMGRGKGYYDRLLPSLGATKIGVCFGFQLLPSIPAGPLDEPMDGIITERETLDTPPDALPRKLMPNRGPI